MKHLTIIGLFFCTLLGSCDTNEAYGGWGMQENYSLTAPNGQKVASNMESLTRKISKAVEKNFPRKQRHQNHRNHLSGSSGEKVYTCSSTDRKKCPNCSVVKKTDGNVECFCPEGQRKYCELTETSI